MLRLYLWQSQSLIYSSIVLAAVCKKDEGYSPVGLCLDLDPQSGPSPSEVDRSASTQTRMPRPTQLD